MIARFAFVQPAGARFPDDTSVRSRPKLRSLPLYLLVGIAVRLILFGNPVAMKDEQFYLLVGQRMAQGALPFVDLWDRKPWGLFAIYRSAYLFPRDPVIAYQLLGLLFSVLTALVIERTARLIAPRRAARLAGLVYLLWQPVFNVASGQSPVFYNLPVALAALIVIKARMRAKDPLLARRGLEAMLLLGIAMQIKYTVVFEGIALGLMLLARGRADGWRWSRLAAAGSAWVGTALAPTAAVALGYLMSGHGEAFVQANFISIFGRDTNLVDCLKNLGEECLEMIPFILAVLITPRLLRPLKGQEHQSLHDLKLWALAAITGFLVFGTWYDHYLGPVLVPLSILAAPCLARKQPRERWYARLLLGVGVIGAVIVPLDQVRRRGTSDQFEKANSAIARELHGRCLYVFDGESAFYRTTNACIPTRFAFPSHLSNASEANAIGVDTSAEVQRIFDTKPGVVVVNAKRPPRNVNDQTRTIVLDELHDGYERYARVKLGTRKFELWKLRNNR